MPPPAVPPAPSAAREVFGDALAVAERYAALLAGDGVERGLIGPREVGRLWERHLLNCAVLGEVVPRQSTVVDVGSGAGLPGVILAVARPDLRVTLLEPLLRRATFLGECVENLGLSNVEVRRARAEEQTGPPEADVVTARAVAPLGRLAEWTLPLLVPGGRLLALKGDRADAELDEAAAVLERYEVQSAEVLRVGHGKVEPPATVVRVVAGRRRRGSAPAGSPHGRRGGSSRGSGSRDRDARGGNGRGRGSPGHGKQGEHSEHVAQSKRKRKR